MPSPDSHERRKYRRVQTALYCRPAGMKFLARQREPIDVSLGGVRVSSDEMMRVGDFLKMEFFRPDVEPVTYTAEVVWVDSLTEGSPAKFDVGLRFVQLEPGALQLLLEVLGPPEE
jgi:hypothetical protein